MAAKVLDQRNVAVDRAPNRPPPLVPRSVPWKIAALYAGAGALWILLSDSALQALSLSDEGNAQLQTFKGVAFVAFSAILLYVILRKPMAAIDQEIERRTLTENDLRKSQAMLERSQRIAKIGSWEYDIQRDHLVWSDPVFEMFHVDKHEFTSDFSAYLQRVAPEDRERVQRARDAAVAGKARLNIEHAIMLPHGERRFIRVFSDLTRDDEGRPWRLTGVAMDITDRKEAESAHRESEERFRLLVASISDYAIVTLDPQGRITSWNPGAEHIFGWREHEILGESIARFCTPEDVINRLPEIEIETAAERGRFEQSHWRVRKDGTRFWVHVVVTAIRDENGDLRGFAKVTRDLTEIRNAEESIRKLNAELELRVKQRTAQLEAKTRELETFTYSVSHDLKAPLRGIDGYSRLLLEDHAGQLDDEGRAFLDNIRQATQTMGRLIDDLLEYSRFERRESCPQDVNVNDIVANLLDERAPDIEAANVTVSLDLPQRPLHADAHGLSSALRNLIDNALKFGRDQPAPAIHIGGTVDDERWMLYVRDNGVGFDPKFAESIFTIFSRLHRAEDYPGTGIGLAIVQKAMERLGGHARAESEPGKSTTFYLEAPQSP